MRRFNWLRLEEALILGFLAFSVLWRGGKSLEATWLLAGIVGLVTFMSWRRGGEAAGKQAVPLPLWTSAMLFLGWSVASYVLSSTANYGLDEILRDVSFSLLFFWLIRHPEREVFGGKILSVIVWSAMLAAAIGVAVYVFQPVDRFVGTFFDARFHTDYWPNAWAQFLLLAWPATFVVLARKRGHWKFLSAALLGFLLGSFFLSYSRGALLAFMGQLVLLSILLLWMKRGTPAFSSKRILSFIGSLLIILVAGGITFSATNALRARSFDVQSVTDKVTFNAAEGISSVSERSQFWGQALVLANKRPIFGWGPYSFRFTQPPLMEGVLATSDHPHNVFLKLASERGWPAFIFFLLILLLVGVSAFVRMIRMKTVDPLNVFLFVAIAGVVAHNLIDYNLQFVGIALPFWLILAMLAKPAAVSRAAHHTMRTVEVILATALLLTAVLEGRYLVLSSLGRHAEATGKIEEAMTWYEQSRGERFSRDLYLSEASLFLDSGDGTRAFEAIERYLDRNAEDPRAWKLLGLIYGRSGDRAATERAFTEAYERGKFTDPTMVRLFLETLPREHVTVRQQELESLFDAYVVAIMRNEHFIALSGAPEEVIVIAELLDSIFPSTETTRREDAAKALEHAKEERDRFTARAPGMLW